MSQLALFDAPDTIPSPLCVADGKCPRQGRAVLGPSVPVSATCVNQSIACLTCGATGIRSTNLAVKPA